MSCQLHAARVIGGGRDEATVPNQQVSTSVVVSDLVMNARAISCFHLRTC